MKNAETKKVEKTEKEIIANSKKTLSDEDLQSKLNSINLEQLTIKANTNKSIWKKELTYKNNERSKGLVGKLRNEQIKLSKKVVFDAKTKDKNQQNSINELYDFYKKSLYDLNTFSNIKESNPNYSIIQLAHAILKANKNF